MQFPCSKISKKINDKLCYYVILLSVLEQKIKYRHTRLEKLNYFVTEKLISFGNNAAFFPFAYHHSCDCLAGWKGAFCTEMVTVCDPEHDPPHLCKQGGTCVPLPNGYMCHCPLGTSGTYCEQGMSSE